VLIQREDQRVVAIALMMAAIICVNYFALYVLHHEHALYRSLFYLPLVLGTFWFALKGALIISISTLLLYLPCGIQLWKGFSTEDARVLGEALIYVAITLIFGCQVQKAKKERFALIEAERLSAIGRTVVEVAHDMRAPLVAIGGFTAQVSKSLNGKDSRNRKKLDIVGKEAARLDGMVREMLDFGKAIELYRLKTDLNDLVLETAELVRQSATDQGVELDLRLARHLPPVSLDANRMKQVILNLITNAVQASSKGDTVKVSTRLADRWNAMLDVADTGCGIDEEAREKIFLPFYSTKKEGTGLGLPIVKKIVEAHGGELRVRSNRERGVTFTVRLPLI
jgi:two-component system sensor histidine kinase HydH